MLKQSYILDWTHLAGISVHFRWKISIFVTSCLKNLNIIKPFRVQISLFQGRPEILNFAFPTQIWSYICILSVSNSLVSSSSLRSTFGSLYIRHWDQHPRWTWRSSWAHLLIPKVVWRVLLLRAKRECVLLNGQSSRTCSGVWSA
jgi:hypothetical protein